MITQAVMTLNDTSPMFSSSHHSNHRCGRLPVWPARCEGLAMTTHSLLWDATLMPVTGRILHPFFKPLLKLFNHLFLPRIPKKTQKQVCVELRNKPTRIGSRREKVPGVRGERLKVPVVWVGGSDGALLAVNEG